MIATVNPATGESWPRSTPLTESQLDEKLARAAEAFRTYRRTTFAERAGWMSRAAEILESEKDAFARIMTLEMGKPLEAARAGGRQVRHRLPLLRRARRAPAGR